MMKILIISPYLPYPLDDGDKIRLFNLIRRIAYKYEVSIVSFVRSLQEEQFIPELKKYCSQVEIVLMKERSKLAKLHALIQCLVSGDPLESKFAFDYEMKEKIRRLVARHHFDIIQIEHTFMAPYIKVIPNAYNAKKIIAIYNIGFIQFYRMFRIERALYTKIRYFINWTMMKKWEVKFLENFDKCITVSFQDKQILNSENQKLDVSVIQNGVDVNKYRPLPVNSGTKNILFIGFMDYVANHDAALYFYHEIFPIIKKQIPHSKFFIVGKNPKQGIKELTKDKDVIVTGYVNDVRSYYQDCDISVVPLRAGGGTRLKILEAMAFGRPVISTSIGCEGLDVVNGHHLLIADDAQQFAEKTLRLLSDRKLYKRIVREARQLIASKYDWDAIAEQLLIVYSEITLKPELRTKTH